MKYTIWRGFMIIQLFLCGYAGRAFAQPGFAGDAVTSRTNTTLVQRRDEWVPLDEELAMPGDITVFTNAAFQLKDGKKRDLKEGQMLRADGYLLNPDGTTEPVCDHLVISGAGVTVVKDGEAAPLTDPLTLPDGTVIESDGFYTHPNGGRRSRLVDGQMLRLDGTPVTGLDTISLKDGKVVVYKSGALLTIDAPNKIMGMFDGTRVNARGVVSSNDGNSFQLAEGQTITVPGVRASF